MTDPVKVVCGYPYGNIHPNFHHSLLRLKDYDWMTSGHLARPDWLCAAGTTNITRGRNEIVRTFLKHTDAEWLWFVDTDQVFTPDILERLIASADPVERPIVSALIMAQREHGVSPACSIPGPDHDFFVPTEIPADRYWACLPGTGCVVIHRSVLEAIGEKYKTKYFTWFADPDYINPTTGEPDTLGEDYTFMLRALEVGATPVIDTTIEAGHDKNVTLTTADFRGRRHLPPPKNYAVIPVKDQLGMTQHLVRSLAEQGDVDGIFIFDNGSNSTTRNWLQTQTFAEVFDAKDLGIHQMWNLGIEEALRRAPVSNIALLNNDLDPGPGMLANMAATLRADPMLVTVCPNYDGRTIEDAYEATQTLCGEKYDGTGGFAGFAFMVKSEWFSNGYRFPEFCKWWFGDNHFLSCVLSAGGVAGICRDATVEHVNGGGQTGDWYGSPEMQAQLAADEAAFRQWALEQAA